MKPAAQDARHLPRVLRFFDVSVLSSASMGPAYSLASTMGPMVAAAGAFAPLSLLAVCAIMLCIAIGFAQLTRVAPNAGSSYSWIRMAFGSRAGAYGAWLLLLSNFFATMATAVPAGIYTLDLLAPGRAQDPMWDAGVGALWIVASTVLLYAGIRPAALVTALALALELGVLACTALAAVFLPHHAAMAVHPAASQDTHAFTLSLFGFVSAMTLGVWMSDGWEVSASASEEVNDDPRAAGRGGITGLVITAAVLAAVFLPHHAAMAVHPAASQDTHAFTLSLFGFVSAMTLGVWMSDGWEVSASASEEVSDDPRAAGRGGITGLVITAAVLAAAMAAYLHLGSVKGFSDNQADAMRYVADLLGGGPWRPVIIATVLVSTSSTLWTTILYLSRSVYAMGRDGVLPRALGRLDVRREPLWALAVVGVLVTICELVTGLSPTAADALTAVLNASSVFLGLLFVLSAAAAVRFFLVRREALWGGIVAPFVGLLTLGGIMAATISFEDRFLAYIALAGVCMGLPFSLWRGAAVGKAAGHLPGHCEPTALAPPL